MVACDDTRHVVFPQPALYSDLAHLGQGLNLPDYPLCALLFVSDKGYEAKANVRPVQKLGAAAPMPRVD